MPMGVIYFFVSEDGLIDLLKKPDGCNMLIILAALLIYDLNSLKFQRKQTQTSSLKRR